MYISCMPQIILGCPISANAMYRISKNKLIKSKKYRDWLEANIPIIQQGPKPNKFPITVCIQIMDGRGWTNKRDLDNVAKALIDVLVKGGAIPDDNIKYIKNIELKFLDWPTKKGEALTFISWTEED